MANPKQIKSQASDSCVISPNLLNTQTFVSQEDINQDLAIGRAIKVNQIATQDDTILDIKVNSNNTTWDVEATENKVLLDNNKVSLMQELNTATELSQGNKKAKKPYEPITMQSIRSAIRIATGLALVVGGGYVGFSVATGTGLTFFAMSLAVSISELGFGVAMQYDVNQNGQEFKNIPNALRKLYNQAFVPDSLNLDPSNPNDRNFKKIIYDYKFNSQVQLGQTFNSLRQAPVGLFTQFSNLNDLFNSKDNTFTKISFLQFNTFILANNNARNALQEYYKTQDLGIREKQLKVQTLLNALQNVLNKSFQTLETKRTAINPFTIDNIESILINSQNLAGNITTRQEAKQTSNDLKEVLPVIYNYITKNFNQFDGKDEIEKRKLALDDLITSDNLAKYSIISDFDLSKNISDLLDYKLAKTNWKNNVAQVPNLINTKRNIIGTLEGQQVYSYHNLFSPNQSTNPSLANDNLNLFTNVVQKSLTNGLPEINVYSIDQGRYVTMNGRTSQTKTQDKGLEGGVHDLYSIFKNMVMPVKGKTGTVVYQALSDVYKEVEMIEGKLEFKNNEQDGIYTELISLRENQAKLIKQEEGSYYEDNGKMYKLFKKHYSTSTNSNTYTKIVETVAKYPTFINKDGKLQFGVSADKAITFKMYIPSKNIQQRILAVTSPSDLFMEDYYQLVQDNIKARNKEGYTTEMETKFNQESKNIFQDYEKKLSSLNIASTIAYNATLNSGELVTIELNSNLKGVISTTDELSLIGDVTGDLQEVLNLNLKGQLVNINGEIIAKLNNFSTQAETKSEILTQVKNQSKLAELSQNSNTLQLVETNYNNTSIDSESTLKIYQWLKSLEAKTESILNIAKEKFKNDKIKTQVDETTKYSLLSTILMPRTVSANAYNLAWQRIYGGRDLIAQRRTSEGTFFHQYEHQSIIENKSVINAQTNSLTRAKSDLQNWSDLLPSYSFIRNEFIEGREYGDNGFYHYIDAATNPLKNLNRHLKEANNQLERKFTTDNHNSSLVYDFHEVTAPLDKGAEQYVPIAIPKNQNNTQAVEASINNKIKQIADLDIKLLNILNQIKISDVKLNEKGALLSSFIKPLLVNVKAFKDGQEINFQANFNNAREATLLDVFNDKNKNVGDLVGLSKQAKLKITEQGEIVNTLDSSFNYTTDEATKEKLVNWNKTYNDYYKSLWQNSRDTTQTGQTLLNANNLIQKYQVDLRNKINTTAQGSIERLLIEDHIMITNGSSLSNNLITTKQLLKAIPNIYNDIKTLLININPNLGKSIDNNLKVYFDSASINQLANQIGVDLNDKEIQTAFNLTNGLNKLVTLVESINKNKDINYNTNTLLRQDWQNIFDNLFPNDKPNLYNQLNKGEKLTIQNVQVSVRNLDTNLVEEQTLFVPLILKNDKPSNKAVVFNGFIGSIREIAEPGNLKEAVINTLKLQGKGSSIFNQTNKDDKPTFYRTEEAFSKKEPFNGLHLIIENQPKLVFEINNNPEEIKLNIEKIVALTNITNQNRIDKLENTIQDSFARFESQVVNNISKKFELTKDKTFDGLILSLNNQIKENVKLSQDLLDTSNNVLANSINQIKIQSSNISKLLKLNKAKKAYQAESYNYNQLQKEAIDVNQQLEKVTVNKETLERLNKLNVGINIQDKYSRHNFAAIEQLNQLISSIGQDSKDLITDTVYLPEKLADLMGYKTQGSQDKPKGKKLFAALDYTPAGKLAKYVGSTLTNKAFAGLDTIIGNTLQTGQELIVNKLSNIWFDIGSKRTVKNMGKILIPQNPELGGKAFDFMVMYVQEAFDFQEMLFEDKNKNVNTLKQRSLFGGQNTTLNSNPVNNLMGKMANYVTADKYYFTTDPTIKMNLHANLQGDLMSGMEDINRQVKDKYFIKPIDGNKFTKAFKDYQRTGFEAKNIPNAISNRLQNADQRTIANNIAANFYKNEIMPNYLDDAFEFISKASINQGVSLDRATFDGWVSSGDERVVFAISNVFIEQLADNLNKVNSYDMVRLELIGNHLSGRRLMIKDKSVIGQFAGEFSTVNSSIRASAYLLSSLESISYLGTAMQYGFGEMSKLKDSEGKRLISNKQIKIAQTAFYKYLMNQVNRGLFTLVISILFKNTVDGAAGNKILSDLYYKKTFNILQNALNTNFFASMILHDNYVRSYYGEKAASTLIGNAFGSKAQLDAILDTISQSILGSVTGVQINQILQAGVIGKQILGDSVKKYEKGDNLNKTIQRDLASFGVPEFLSIGTAGIINFVATGTGTQKSIEQFIAPELTIKDSTNKKADPIPLYNSLVSQLSFNNIKPTNYENAVKIGKINFASTVAKEVNKIQKEYDKGEISQIEYLTKTNKLNRSIDNLGLILPSKRRKSSSGRSGGFTVASKTRSGKLSSSKRVSSFKAPKLIINKGKRFKGLKKIQKK